MPMSRDLKWALVASLTLHCLIFIAIPLVPKMQQVRTRVIASHVKLVRVPPAVPPKVAAKPPPVTKRPRLVASERRQYHRHRPVHRRAHRRVVPEQDEPDEMSPSVVVAMTPPMEEVAAPQAEPEAEPPVKAPTPAEEPEPEKTAPSVAPPEETRPKSPEPEAVQTAAQPAEVKIALADKAEAPQPVAPPPSPKFEASAAPAPAAETRLERAQLPIPTAPTQQPLAAADRPDDTTAGRPVAVGVTSSPSAAGANPELALPVQQIALSNIPGPAPVGMVNLAELPRALAVPGAIGQASQPADDRATVPLLGANDGLSGAPAIIAIAEAVTLSSPPGRGNASTFAALLPGAGGGPGAPGSDLNHTKLPRSGSGPALLVSPSGQGQVQPATGAPRPGGSPAGAPVDAIAVNPGAIVVAASGSASAPLPSFGRSNGSTGFASSLGDGPGVGGGTVVAGPRRALALGPVSTASGHAGVPSAHPVIAASSGSGKAGSDARPTTSPVALPGNGRGSSGDSTEGHGSGNGTVIAFGGGLGEGPGGGGDTGLPGARGLLTLGDVGVSSAHPIIAASDGSGGSGKGGSDERLITSPVALSGNGRGSSGDSTEGQGGGSGTIIGLGTGLGEGPGGGGEGALSGPRTLLALGPAGTSTRKNGSDPAATGKGGGPAGGNSGGAPVALSGVNGGSGAGAGTSGKGSGSGAALAFGAGIGDGPSGSGNGGPAFERGSGPALPSAGRDLATGPATATVGGVGDGGRAGSSSTPVSLAGTARDGGVGDGGAGASGSGKTGLPLGSGIGAGPGEGPGGLGEGTGGPAVGRGSQLAFTTPSPGVASGRVGAATNGSGGGKGSGSGGGTGVGQSGPVGGLLGREGVPGGGGLSAAGLPGPTVGGWGGGGPVGGSVGVGMGGAKTGIALIAVAPGVGVGSAVGSATGSLVGTLVTPGAPVAIAVGGGGRGGGGGLGSGLLATLSGIVNTGDIGAGPGEAGGTTESAMSSGVASPTGIYAGVTASFDMPMGITNGDYESDAQGMPNLLAEVRKRTNVHVTVTQRTVGLKLAEIKDTPVLHLRGHKAFSFSPQEREALRQYVAQGGTILAEDSHGPFGECVRREMKLIFNKPLHDLPVSHEIYHTQYDLKTIPAGDMGERYPLQGVNVGGRLGVIFSRNDYGDCWEGTGAWVKPESREPAFQMGTNLLVYIVAHWNERK